MAHSSSSLAILLLATPLAVAPLVTVLAVFVAGDDVTEAADGGGAAAAVAGTGSDGGTTAAGVAAVVVTLAAAAIAEGDRHGDAATNGTTAAAAGFGATGSAATDADGTTDVICTGGDAFVVVDSDDGVEIAVVADDTDDVVAGGIAGADGVVATGSVASAVETGAGDADDADNDDFVAAAEGSLLPAIPPVTRPPLNGMTGGANLRRGVSSVDGRVVDPPVDDTTPSTVPLPSPVFSASCARWSSSTCRKRSLGTAAGRGPASVT